MPNAALTARIAALEEHVAALQTIIAGLVGNDQALLCGLRACLEETDPALRSAVLQRLLEKSGAFLQGMPIGDDVLDLTAAARQKIGEVIHQAIRLGSLPPAERAALRRASDPEWKPPPTE